MYNNSIIGKIKF